MSSLPDDSQPDPKSEPAQPAPAHGATADAEGAPTGAAPEPDPARAESPFVALGLSEPLLRALSDVGYETPSPIQLATIPPLLTGRDVLGQAQTGTGKTAAFALPMLTHLELAAAGAPQGLVLVPTRELAIQVAEAFARYAAHLPGFRVLPVYGGQSYRPQLDALRRGVHIVVGTPGRIIDHLERGTLDASRVRYVVLDEADEMLRMGFVDDVETILKHTPADKQVALFSATLPSAIQRIARAYLRDPAVVRVAAATATAAQVRQRAMLVRVSDKLDALTRVLEAEPFDGVIVFVRTRLGAEEIADRLQARGYAAAAIHGDIAQAQREAVVGKLRAGQIDLLVATDVAARGLDVERISHVINFDMPSDPESYVHRIGRTGRAGRSGEAILLATHRERGLLNAIERATRQPIEPMRPPSADAINEQRVARLTQQIAEALTSPEIGAYREALGASAAELDVEPMELAAALALISRGGAPLLMPPEPPPRERAPRREPPPRRDAPSSDRDDARAHRGDGPPMETFRLEVGAEHGVDVRNIVGAIANEAELDSRFIGRVELRGDHTLVELPKGMPAGLMQHLAKVRVGGRRLGLRPTPGGETRPRRRHEGRTRPGPNDAPRRR